MSRAPHMDKLWRILYSPRSAFDELLNDLQITYPLVTVLSAVAISALVIGFVASDSLDVSHSVSKAGEHEIFQDRKQSRLAENNQDLKLQRKREIRSLFQDYQDSPESSHQSNGPWAPIIGVLGSIIYFAILTTCFFVVGARLKIHLTWIKWFGFVCWAHVPVVPVAVLDVLLVAADWDGIVLYIFSIGNSSSYLSPAALGSILYWVWSLTISIQGLRSWTQKRIGSCIGITIFAHSLLLVPVLLILVYVWVASLTMAA